MTDIAQFLDEGNIFLINQDYEAAEIRLSSAIEVIENSRAKNEGSPICTTQLFRAFSHRSAARLFTSSKITDALTDARSAINILEEIDRSKVETDLTPGEGAMAHARAGMSLYKLEKYTDAKDSFSSAVKIGNGGSFVNWSDWILRCEKMLTKTPELPKKSPDPVQESSTTVSPPTNVVSSGSSQTRSQPTCPKYQYYQSDTVLTIQILQPNVQADDLNVDISLDKLTVQLKKDSVEFTVICGTLFSVVDVSKCKVKVTDEKVLIKLRKKHKHEWHELFGSGANDEDKKDVKQEDGAGTEKKAPEEIPKIDTENSVSRPYSSHRDWNAIERNLKEEEANEKPQGDEALNKLFKEIYGKGDEETRRAMIKSYQTSGGTVLSTNWDEVAKKDYEEERECPKGMEWKNWEGKKLPQKD